MPRRTDARSRRPGAAGTGSRTTSLRAHRARRDIDDEREQARSFLGEHSGE